MRDSTIAGTYADVLLELAQRAEDPQGWGKMFGDVAAAVENDTQLRHFLESPRIGDARKINVLHRAFANVLPAPLVRFLETLVRHRRQMLLTYDRRRVQRTPRCAGGTRARRCDGGSRVERKGARGAGGTADANCG